jgi:hydrogenase nickel incorporation protein HypA/HybF
VHELSITQSLLELALQHAEAAGARRVTDLNLVIGDLSSVLDECVQFYWDMISEGSLAAGSRLHFRRVPVQMTCQDCGANSDLAEIESTCPGCGGTRLQVSSGDEFYLDSIDIEKEPVAASGAPA